MSNNKFFGRVVGTQNNPVTPVSFPFWGNDINAEVEIGDIVTAEQPQENIKVVGIVDGLELFSDLPDTLRAFFSHNFGDVTSEPPTDRPLVLQGNVQVAWRSDYRTRPIRHGAKVRHATSEEIMSAYAGDIPEESRIVAGLIRDSLGNYIPVPVHADFLLGPEAAHINITGASGLATKTSYAVFLMRSLLSYAKKFKKNIAIVAFNVKHDDLLWLDKCPKNMDKMVKMYRQSGLYQKAIELGIPVNEPLECKIFASSDPSGKPYSFRPEPKTISTFSYGLCDLVDLGGHALLGLLEPETITEKSEALIYSIASEVELNMKKKRPISFANLFEELNKRLKEEWVTIAGMGHHEATIRKVSRDLNTIAQYKLPGLIRFDSPTGDPLPLTDLKPGNLWIVDISRLNEQGQRLVFYRVLSHIEVNLAKGTKGFPEKVIVFVDELNKFAPSGALTRLPLKSQIIDIAARGRSIGLTLLGAQQFASRIDDQVFGNSGTFVVGRTDAVELRNYNYAWMSEGFKKKAQSLPKGQLLVRHSAHPQPFLVNFPIPLHSLWQFEQEGKIKPAVEDLLSPEEVFVGLRVRHAELGKTGKIIQIDGTGENMKIKIEFDDGDVKVFSIKATRIERV